MRGARWTDRTVRAALELPGPAVDLGYSGISTDTRTLAPGALFVALEGERFDGHRFLPAAARASAGGAVVREDTPDQPGLVLYRVPNTLDALGRLGRSRRRAVSGPVIAITGTNGKTSTKEMIAAVLATRYRTHKTRANLNNLIGIPLSILEAPADAEALVLEAGASVPGELARARQIIEPSLVVITNVAVGHLEGFGSLDQVMQEKVSFADGVEVAIVGTEPHGLGELARNRARKVIVAGLNGADCTPDRVDLGVDGRPVLTLGSHRFVVDARGRHQAANAMLAWAVAEVLGLDLSRAARALETLGLPGGRGELIQQGALTILNDAYNANPGSFRAAIELARALRGNRRLVFVAGTMLELGAAAPSYHAEIARHLVGARPELLVGVGEFVPALEPYRESLGDRLLLAGDVESLAPLLAERLVGDELIVLKASRGVALERLLPDLVAHASPGP
ncbi:MAG: UDP-N-acetylmuramoyl-tripeptide--D-alanyl-D-alanine ligase [Gemmatimonadales bacterium]